MDGNRLGMDGNGLEWMGVDGNGWKWMGVDGKGLGMAVPSWRREGFRAGLTLPGSQSPVQAPLTL